MMYPFDLCLASPQTRDIFDRREIFDIREIFNKREILEKGEILRTMGDF